VSRLRLRPDAYVIPSEDGASILTNSGQTALVGPSIFQWLDRLKPYLDGRFSLAELTASVPPDRREMIERIVGALRDKGLLIESAVVHGAPITEDELAAFQASATASLRPMNESTVLLVGSGPLFDMAVAAVAMAGPAQTHVFTTESATAPAVVHDLLSTMHAAAGLVIAVSDAVLLVRSLDEACAKRGIPLVAAVMSGDGSWLGPFTPAEGRPLEWSGAWRRLLALGHRNGGSGSRRPTPAAHSAIVANQLVRAAIRSRAGAVGAAQLLSVSLPDLHTADHRYLAHPYSVPAVASGPDELRSTVRRLAAGERLSEEVFAARVASCLDDQTGILSRVTEDDFFQLPLAISRVTVSDPVALLGSAASNPVVYGTGTSMAHARRAAAMDGLAVYGALMVDPRRLHPRADADGALTGDIDAALTAFKTGRWTGFAWGYGLTDGRPYQVPAELIFPSPAGTGPHHVPPPGVAAGYDWDEAVSRGLLGQCLALTLDCGPSAVAAIQWRAAPLDDAGRRHRMMANQIGLPVQVYQVSGAVRLPVLAMVLDGVTVSYSAGLSFSDALRDGLAGVLRYHQAHSAGPIECAPLAVPPLTQARPGAGPADWPTWRTDSTAIAAELAALGRIAVVVPLDHDPAVLEILPYVAHTVLVDA
jgi:hypothetical protein